MTLLERLLHRLDLTQVQTDTFHGGAGEGGATEANRLFGGLVAAQATMAAIRSVADAFSLHSLHAYFLRPGQAAADISYKVSRLKEGRNFQVREVQAWQHDELIFQLTASFQLPMPGVTHMSRAPTVASPEDCHNRDQLRGRKRWRDMPIDVRMITDITSDEPRPPLQQTWLKANGTLPKDPSVHLALVVYASDRSLLDTAWRPHAQRGDLIGASLDHSMWFHAPLRFDSWLLYDMHSPRASDSRGLSFGSMYTESGQLVVTTAQEGMLRVRPKN